MRRKDHGVSAGKDIFPRSNTERRNYGKIDRPRTCGSTVKPSRVKGPKGITDSPAVVGERLGKGGCGPKKQTLTDSSVRSQRGLTGSPLREVEHVSGEVEVEIRRTYKDKREPWQRMQVRFLPCARSRGEWKRRSGLCERVRDRW